MVLAALIISVGAGDFFLAGSRSTAGDVRPELASAVLDGTTANVHGTLTSGSDPNLTATRPRGTMGPLRRLRSNPRYFTADGTTAVYLTGSHNWLNLVDGSPTNPPAALDYGAYVANLRRWHHNFIRLWAWDVTFDSIRGRTYFYSPQPYVRSGPGKALDGRAKFDLSRLNQAYFDRLRSRIVKARRAGIYVAIMLFEGYTPDKGPLPSAYQGHPFAAENNVNGIDGDRNKDGRLRELYTLPEHGGLQKAWEIQKAYVRKVIDSVNDLDNVLYEIVNEAPTASTAWQYELINYIKLYEARKRKQHPVGMTFQFPDGKNAALLESAADWISPRTRMENPPTAKGAKVIVSDSDHLCGICAEANGDWVWREFTRGRNPIFMDAYGDPHWGASSGAHDEARKAMGQTRRLAETIDLAAMRPDRGLASTRYLLANPGREYVVYQPERGPFTLDLVDHPGKAFTVNWIAVTSGTRASETISGGNRVTLTPPFNGAAAAYVRAKNSRAGTSRR